MKQAERHKSISWFKLAEFVERGEKERALGIYKLLALSISDTAFSYQLEGDILLAFDDQLAVTKYLQAIDHHLIQNNLAAAIGTFSHIAILITKINLDLQNCLTKIIETCQNQAKKNELDKLINMLAKSNQNLYEHALKVLKNK